eukprot:7406503-Pyramimonas_sp.AAC.1
MILACADDLWFALRDVILELPLLLPLLQSLDDAIGLSRMLQNFALVHCCLHPTPRMIWHARPSLGASGARSIVDSACSARTLLGDPDWA